MSTIDAEILAALAPVREALLAAASDRAERDRGRADSESQALLAQARTHATAITAQARREGRADAESTQVTLRARARREARAAVLRARAEVYEELRRGARLAAAGLQHQPDYARLRNRLAQAVWRALGGDADVRDADGGGVIGVAAGRRVDCSLFAFADRAVEELAAELFDTATPVPDAVPAVGGAP